MSTNPTARGRRIVLWALLLFFLGQLALGLYLDLRPGEHRFSYVKRHADRVRNHGGSDVVFLGSSRTGSFVHDGEVTRTLREQTGDSTLRAFNCAVPVGDSVAMDYVSRWFIEAGLRPRLAVIELVPEMVGAYNPWVTTHVERQFTWADLPGQFVNILRTNNLARMLGARLVPGYIYRKETLRLLGLLPPPWLPIEERDPDSLGALDWSHIIKTSPETISLPQRTQTNVSLVVKHLQGYRVGGPSLRALKQTIARFREAGVPVVLLGVPLASAHRECYDAQIEQKFQECLRSLEAEQGVRYIDCRNVLPDEQFIDHHHASSLGCLTFSRALGKEYLGPALHHLRKAQPVSAELPGE